MEAFLSLLAAKFTITKALLLIGARIEQFALIAVIFVPLERLIPFHTRQRLFRAQFFLDLLHYFVGGVFIIIFVWFSYHLMPVIFPWANIHDSPVSVRDLPVWGQILVFEAGWTFLGYWLHRLEHVWLPLWRLHSIHESTHELDWLSAFRLHPLEPALFQILTIVPLWFFGMSLPAAIGYSIYTYIFSHVQHANIVFPIGPLRYILPTPQFHRWHHARIYDLNGRPVRSFCNFSQYPIWDQLFGTFYLPNKNPTAYGNAPNVPKDYLAQLAYPFGGHEKIMLWKKSLSQKYRVSGMADKLYNVIIPIHECFERRLIKLCLLRSSTEEGRSVTPVTPIPDREKMK
jgi:sterol desaturase/sphingolipid hydroxylase (fatty acid hydroxylase superfamily)